jgi:hypothetical protein
VGVQLCNISFDETWINDDSSCVNEIYTKAVSDTTSELVPDMDTIVENINSGTLSSLDID